MLTVRTAWDQWKYMVPGRISSEIISPWRMIVKELNVPRSEWYRALGGAITRINPPHTITPPDRHGDQHFVVAVARPELDVEKMARGLLRLVKASHD